MSNWVDIRSRYLSLSNLCSREDGQLNVSKPGAPLWFDIAGPLLLGDLLRKLAPRLCRFWSRPKRWRCPIANRSTLTSVLFVRAYGCLVRCCWRKCVAFEEELLEAVAGLAARRPS